MLSLPSPKLFVISCRNFLLSITPIRKYTVIGSSMLPTLTPGDVVLVNNHRFNKQKLLLHDIIAIKSSSEKDIIKRIVKIGNNGYFVLGDNRKASTDSRQFGWVNEYDIIGKVIYIAKKEKNEHVTR